MVKSKKRKQAHVLSHNGMNLIVSGSLSQPPLNLIISQRPHLHIPSRWALGFQHLNLRGQENSVHSTFLHPSPPASANEQSGERTVHSLTRQLAGCGQACPHWTAQNFSSL